MTKENVKIIEAVLNESITRYAKCAEDKAEQDDPVGKMLFTICANSIRKAFNEFLEENKK